MELSYWQSRWRKNNIGWHMDQVYPPLKKYWPEIELQKRSTVLVPLCGKSLDIVWLMEQEYNVIGVEISALAIRELLQLLGGEFSKRQKGDFTVFSSQNVALWQGDFLKMESEFLPAIDAVYDKAALIALPPDKRKTYTGTVKNIISSHTKMLLNCFEYEQKEMKGPPFTVFREELDQHYGELFSINLLQKQSLFEQLQKFQSRGLSSYLTEKIYLLKPCNR